MSILDRRIADTPLAVIDFETTGLSPRSGCRVIEASVVRIEPGAEPRLVFDTMIDPEGPVYCSSIHGITDEDVVGAPRFCDVAGEFAQACSGAVLAAYNAEFDMRFFVAEQARLPRLADVVIPPYLCLMYLRPLLGIGSRVRLDVAADELGLPSTTHRAAEDCLLGAALWADYVRHIDNQQVVTFGDLRRRGSYQFMESFDEPLIDAAAVRAIDHRSDTVALKPRFEEVRVPNVARTTNASPPLDPVERRRAYWSALRDAWGDDGVLSSQEVAGLLVRQRSLGIEARDVMTVHARFFGEVLAQAVDDDALASHEVWSISKLSAALRRLGWAPGSKMPVARVS